MSEVTKCFDDSDYETPLQERIASAVKKANAIALGDELKFSTVLGTTGTRFQCKKCNQFDVSDSYSQARLRVCRFCRPVKIKKTITLYPWAPKKSCDVIKDICDAFSSMKSGTFKVENAGDACKGKVIITFTK
jgi:hypothetical protein